MSARFNELSTKGPISGFGVRRSARRADTLKRDFAAVSGLRCDHYAARAGGSARDAGRDRQSGVCTGCGPCSAFRHHDTRRIRSFTPSVGLQFVGAYLADDVVSARRAFCESHIPVNRGKTPI